MTEQDNIRIAFEDGDNNCDEILVIYLPSQPFVVGQLVELEVKNDKPEQWDVEPVEIASYEITGIWPIVTKGYTIGNEPYQYISFSITVIKKP